MCLAVSTGVAGVSVQLLILIILALSVVELLTPESHSRIHDDDSQ